MSRFVLYAPNVHTGGGLVLLNALLENRVLAPRVAFLDVRASARVSVQSTTQVHWVAPALSSRFRAELALWRSSQPGDRVLCFHGLPPVIPNAGRVFVFLQNRLLLGGHSLAGFPLRTRLRLQLERFIEFAFRRHVAEYIVQTPSMQSAVHQWHGDAPTVRVIAPIDRLPEAGGQVASGHHWDFVYVADGQAHKNHRVLFEAWRLLSEDGLTPSLALTLGPRDRQLADAAATLATERALPIHNFGHLSRDEVLDLLGRGRALIFPSTSESFGLPLIEATHLGVPIVASELDYVRDVCSPVETFDPRSAVSIARAVKRFLGVPAAPVKLASADEFVTEVMQ